MSPGVLSSREKLIVLAVGAVAVLLAGLFADLVLTRLVCGAWPRGEHAGGVVGIARVIFSGDIRGWVGSTPTGCSLSTPVLWAGPAVVIAVIVTAVVVVVVRRQRYKLSPAYLRGQLLDRREVIAGGGEVKREMGAKQAIERGRKVRPVLSATKGKAFEAADAAFQIGTSQGVPAWISMEDAVLLIGPPRSGKGFGVLTSQIIDAPGPVVTTSTRADNMEATIAARAKKGPVYVFDPAGVSGRRSSLVWSPISGCESGEVAVKRAELLIEATGLGAGEGNNQEFATKAIETLQALLHAAAVGGASLDELYTWTKDPERARAAVSILETQSTLGWGVALNATINLPVEQRSAQWFGVASALGPVDVPTVRALFQPGEDDDVFDVHRFLEENGTLYLISPVRPAGKTSGLGVLLVMLLDAITESAHRKAMLAPGGRLDPPLALILDEIANIFAWPQMPNWMAAGSGEGIQVTAVVQSRSQLRAGWGAEGAATAWEAATRKIILGGGASKQDLEEAVALIGERTVKTVSESWGSDREAGFSDSQAYRAGVSVDELRRLPELMALLLAGRSRAIAVDLIPWTKRGFAEDIKASQAWHRARPGSPDRNALADVYPVRAGATQPAEVSAPIKEPV